MTRQKAIATYKSRAKSLLAYKRQNIASNPRKAYRAMELATALNQAARTLESMPSGEYYQKRVMWINAVRNSPANTAPAQLSLF